VDDERREEVVRGEVPGDGGGAKETKEAQVGQEAQEVGELDGNMVDGVEEVPRGARRSSWGEGVAAEGEAVRVGGGGGAGKDGSAMVKASKGLQDGIEGGAAEGRWCDFPEEDV
jgi:hypothetical protein